MNTGAADVVIVGGGVIGCSIAYHLALAGRSVTLLERAVIAAEASSAAAGILAPIAESHAAGAFLELGVAGLRAFAEEVDAIEVAAGVTVDYRQSGVVRTAMGPEHAAELQARADWAESVGLRARWLDAVALRRLEPAIGDRVAGGLDSPDEAQVHPRRLTLALAHAAARQGAHIREGAGIDSLVVRGSEVCGVRLNTGETIGATTVVLAAGSWSRFCGRPVAEPPVHPVKGQYLLFSAIPALMRRIIYGEHAYLLPRPDGTIYCGATEEPARGYDKRVTAGAVRTLLAAAAELIPAVDGAEVLATGAGLRPGSPDRLPILGLAPGVHGLIAATGHFRNGVLLSLITGRLIADLIVYGRAGMDLTPFSPARFGASAAAETRRDVTAGVSAAEA